MPTGSDDPKNSLLDLADSVRSELGATDDRSRRALLGQFFTPSSTARLMASMCERRTGTIRFLDAGAGVGALTAAWVDELLRQESKPDRLVLTAFELDPNVLPYLRRTLAACQDACLRAGIECAVDLQVSDFIRAGVEALESSFFIQPTMQFDVAVLNPPYKKFRTDSEARELLRRIGVETSNAYSAFVALVVALLGEEGEFVSITPRSFCNGPYFRPFREHLLSRVRLRRLHVFESRSHAFRDDDVLQENIIVHGTRGNAAQGAVCVSQSAGPDEPLGSLRTIPFESVVRSGDLDKVIHLVPDEKGADLAAFMSSLPCTLNDLQLKVSTGKVVDFRARDWLRANPDPDTVPLIYPGHFSAGRVSWPRSGSKKPNAISREATRDGILIQSGIYVIVKRFSSKEEARRVVAAIFDPADVPCELVGFENHLNYYHAGGLPLDERLAAGLACFLNSSAVDSYFRQFNGHTQVNASDLRMLRYPDAASLRELGESVPSVAVEQGELDRIVEEVLGLSAAAL